MDSSLDVSGETAPPPIPQAQNLANKDKDFDPNHKAYGRSLIWISGSVLIIITIAVAWLILSTIETQTKEDVHIALNTIIRTTQEALHNSVIKRLVEVTSWSVSAELQRLVKEQLEIPRNPEALLASPALAKMRALLDPVMEEKGLIGFFIIAPDNISIASMRDANVGTLNLLSQHEDFLPRIFEGNVLISQLLFSDVLLPNAMGELSKDQPTMFVAAPIREKGATIAALTFRIDPVEDFSRITKLGRIGKTGETFAFNKKGQLITQSRFDQLFREIGLLGPAMQSILNIEIRDPGGNMVEGFRPSLSRQEQPLTHMAEQAIAGKAGVNLDGYRDYRGVLVVGAWLWNEDLGFGLAAEIDRMEAYRAYRTTRWALIISLALTVALFLGLSIALDFGRRQALSMAGRIREGSARLQATLENLVEGIITIDEKGIIQSFNPAAEKIFGFRESETIGRSVNMLMPEPYRDEHDGYIRNYLKTGKAKIIGFGREVLGLRKDGSTFPLDLAVSEMVLGGRRWFIGVIRDITERKGMEEELRKLSQAVEQSPASVIITDLEGNIDYVNPKFTKVTGFTPEEVIGKNPRFLKSGDTPSGEYKNLWDTITAGKEWRGEFHNKKKDSEPFWEMASISPIKNEEGVITHYLAVKEDITQRKLTEMKLQKETMVKQLLKDVAIASNEALVMEEAVQVCLDQVCELTGWPVGHSYIFDEKSGELVPTKVWHLNDPKRFATFKKITESIRFSPGTGLPGRVFSSGEPVWIKDVNKDPNFPRAKLANDLGVRAGFGFPILTGKKVVAVLEFFSTEVIEPDEALLEVMANIGTQLGRITERTRAEEKSKKSHQEMRDLYHRLQSVREEERTRIAREVHDELGQMLTALKIDVSWIEKKLPKNQKFLIKKSQTMSDLLDKTIQSVQRITTELRPEVLDMLGLADALEWQAQEFQKRTGIQCDLNISLVDPEIESKRSTTIFRIFQEALTNIARHAQASKTEISFQENGGYFILEIKDDGKGISNDSISDPKSFGLLGMRERVLLWDGEFNINSTEGQGTTVTVRIPKG